MGDEVIEKVQDVITETLKELENHNTVAPPNIFSNAFSAPYMKGETEIEQMLTHSGEAQLLDHCD